MEYKALTYLVLKEGGEKISPGATISEEELYEAGQTDEDIEALIEGGSLSPDLDAELHPDHAPPKPPEAPTDSHHVVSGDGGSGSE